MVDWFLGNYEDPVHETPYDGGEGGYQYIWGGPYEAEEELRDAFPDATDEQITQAVNEIEADGTTDWVPAGGRIQPDDLDDLDDFEPSLGDEIRDRLAALEGQLDEIERHISYWRNRDPQIGHNGPPDEFRLDADDEALVDAQASVTEVRQELSKPNSTQTADVDVIERAESRFKLLAGKISAWAKKVGVALVLGAVGGVGKVIGEGIASDPQAFFATLSEAASTLSEWASYLPPPF